MLGQLVGTPEVIKNGHLANANPPILRTHDRLGNCLASWPCNSLYTQGNRIDEVEFHPAYHALMKLGKTNEVSEHDDSSAVLIADQVDSFAWKNSGRKGAHVIRAAKAFLLNLAESGVNCPLTMTFASTPALGHQAEAAVSCPLVTMLITE